MKKVMLIDVETVKENGYVHKNVLPETVRTTIRRVQQTMLKKVMGNVLYADFLEKVSASLPPTNPIVPLTAADVELLEDYIHPYLVACVDYRIVLPLTLRYRSKSVGKGTDTNHIPADMVEMVRLKDQMKEDVSNYAEELKDKLAGEDCAIADKTTTPWNSIKFK